MPSESSSSRRRFRLRYLVFWGALLVLIPFSPLLIFKIVGAIVPGVKTYIVPTPAMEPAVMLGDYLVASTGRTTPAPGKVIIFKFAGKRDEVEPDLPQHYFERCVAVAGDTLEVNNSVLWVNGKQQQATTAILFDSAFATPITNDADHTFPQGYGFTRDNWGPLRIPKTGDVIPLNDSTYQAWRIFVMREGHKIERDGEAIKVDGQPATSYTVERDYWFGLGDNRWNSLDSRYWGFISYEAIIGTPSFVYWSWPTALDRNNDGSPNPYDPAEALSLWERIGAIRWGRMFRSIE